MSHPKQGYYTPDGYRVPGVTTITGRFKDSGALLHWAFNQGRAAERGEINSLYEKRDEAGDTGTATHFLVFRHLHGLEPLPLEKLDVLDMGEDGKLELTDDYRQSMQSGFDAYLAWERTTKLKIVQQEMRLVSTKYKYGGCPDAIGIMDGVRCLLDWKTSKSVYPDFLIQIAAYGELCENGLLVDRDYAKLGVKVEGYHLCRFSKTFGDFSHHYYPELTVGLEQFLLLRRAYENDKTLKARAG
jgi:hypothetical protein